MGILENLHLVLLAAAAPKEQPKGILENLYSALPSFIPVLLAVAAAVVGLWVANWLLLHRERGLNEEKRFPRRIAMFLLTGFVFSACC